MRYAKCRKPKWYWAFSASAAGRDSRCKLYRQMFNKDLYLLAYGNIYSNQGAMTPGTSGETADGMSEGKIEGDHRADAPRALPVLPGRRRTYIPKKNGKLRPLGMPAEAA